MDYKHVIRGQFSSAELTWEFKEEEPELSEPTAVVSHLKTNCGSDPAERGQRLALGRSSAHEMSPEQHFHSSQKRPLRRASKYPERM